MRSLKEGDADRWRFGLGSCRVSSRRVVECASSLDHVAEPPAISCFFVFSQGLSEAKIEKLKVCPLHRGLLPSPSREKLTSVGFSSLPASFASFSFPSFQETAAKLLVRLPFPSSFLRYRSSCFVPFADFASPLAFTFRSSPLSLQPSTIITATEVAIRRESVVMISTGSKAVDAVRIFLLLSLFSVFDPLDLLNRLFFSPSLFAGNSFSEVGSRLSPSQRSMESSELERASP